MQQFEVGKTYTARSVCNSDCVFSFTVTKRTAKFITTVNSMGEERRSKVQTHEIFGDTETVRPLGGYSMAPIIRADEA